MTPATAVVPFEPARVRLTDGPIKTRQDLNHGYLLALQPDRLLHNFRVNAGFTSPAEPLGGWEAPSCGLRGHFVGHYLSACANAYAATGVEALRDRVAVLVRELARCQAALGQGYLAAFPASELNTIETKFDGSWAPYYTLHKILAGLLDAHRHCMNAEALELAVRLANYIAERIEKVPRERLESMLRTDRPNPPNEFGGMSEVLQDLHALTHDPAHLLLADVFEPPWFIDPLMRGDDQLTALHCNTHIPIVLGLARRFERTGQRRCRDAVAFFWDRTALARSYVNGGSSGPRPDGLEKSTGAEHWPEPNKLAATLTPKINESCVTHNMMRLTDALFRWTGDPRYADFYERAYFNSLLCMQHPGRLGGYLYDHPLGSGSRKRYGGADDAFWCCYGTSVEAFARLNRGIFYRDGSALWVNLMIASEAIWPEKELRVEQVTRFPEEDTTRLVFHCDKPLELTVNMRVPAWAVDGTTITINGEPFDAGRARPGTFVPIKRTWRDGNVLEARFPMRLRAEAMPDDLGVVAFLYGPLVLAAVADEELVLHAGEQPKGADKPLTFRIRVAGGALVKLIPLNRIVEETYGVYFRVGSW